MSISSTAGASNTPAQNTDKTPPILLVDWVSCSFYFASTFADLCTVLGLPNKHDDFQIKEGSVYQYAGYTETLNYGYMQILRSPLEDGTSKFFINFSGQGCREFEQHSSLEWVDLFAILIDNFYAKFTRLDLAIDDFEQNMTVGQVRKAVYEKRCITKLKKWGDRKEGNITTGNEELTMDNFYLGSKTSRYAINVYDKKLERQDKKKHVTVDYWTRFECRFKEEYAHRFVINCITSKDNLGEILMSFLNLHISFLKTSDHTNKARAAQKKENQPRWWRDFVNTTKKLSLSQKAPDKTIEQVKHWIEHSVSAMLFTIKTHDPDDYESYLQQLSSIGNTKFSKKHQLIIDSSQKKKPTSQTDVDQT